LARFRDFHSGSPGKNSHLDVASVESCRVYYKGEGGGFPQVRAVVSLVCPCCPWLVLAPRVLQLCTNHFVWVVGRPVWVTKACQLFLVPSRSSNPPLYPSKGCELGSVLWLLLFRCFLLGLTFEPFEELGVRHCPNKQIQPKTWSKFFLTVVLAMGRLVKVDGLVPNKFYILKFCWRFGTFYIRWNKYARLE
jgi:hypothetical protein